jgi:hypothetical protein
MYVGYQAGGTTGGQGGGFQRGVGGRGRSSGRGRAQPQGRSRTAFADYVPNGRGHGNSASPGTANRPNPVKIQNNWNVCYLCGFDIEDGHTSMTCHLDWRKPTHYVTFMRSNA